MSRKDFGAKPLSLPQPVWIIGTYDENGVPNAMNAAWGGISEESEISFCLSPEHKTVENILKKGFFTVSMGDAAHAALPAPAGTTETVRSVAEFNDFTDRTLDRKHPTRLRLRLELDAGAALRIALQYDGDGVWRDECVLAPGGKRTVAVPLLPRRCDHYRVRLTGEGGWKLWELARENTVNE